MFWYRQGLCALPVFLVICASCTFIIPFVIAVLRHDVDPIIPYISDSGALPPESCIFGLLTVSTACSGAATVYSRYKFVEKLNEDVQVVNPWKNTAGLVMGILSCFGMCVVATFQETTVTIMHDIGAGLFFISGVIYLLLQCCISYQLYPYGSSMKVFYVRVVIATVALLALFPIICAAFVEQTTLHRHTLDKDYPYFLASSICEWIVAFSFIFFFMTYIDEFKLFTLQVSAELEGYS